MTTKNCTLGRRADKLIRPRLSSPLIPGETKRVCRETHMTGWPEHTENRYDTKLSDSAENCENNVKGKRYGLCMRA